MKSQLRWLTSPVLMLLIRTRLAFIVCVLKHFNLASTNRERRFPSTAFPLCCGGAEAPSFHFFHWEWDLWRWAFWIWTGRWREIEEGTFYSYLFCLLGGFRRSRHLRSMTIHPSPTLFDRTSRIATGNRKCLSIGIRETRAEQLQPRRCLIWSSDTTFPSTLVSVSIFNS